MVVEVKDEEVQSIYTWSIESSLTGRADELINCTSLLAFHVVPDKRAAAGVTIVLEVVFIRIKITLQFIFFVVIFDMV